MANFTFIIGDAAPAGSTVAWVEAKDEGEARDLARAWLEKSEHLQKIEVHRGETTFVVRRPGSDIPFAKYPDAS